MSELGYHSFETWGSVLEHHDKAGTLAGMIEKPYDSWMPAAATTHRVRGTDNSTAATTSVALTIQIGQ